MNAHVYSWTIFSIDRYFHRLSPTTVNMISREILQKFLDAPLRISEWTLLAENTALYAPEGIRLCKNARETALEQGNGAAAGSISEKLITLEKYSSQDPEHVLFGKTLDDSCRSLIHQPVPRDIPDLVIKTRQRSETGEWEKAIADIENRLESRTEASDGFLRSELLRILGRLYRACPTGDTPARKERALQLYSEAEKVFSRSNFPREWAILRSNAANVFLVRQKGTRAENFERATALNEEAIDILTATAFPVDHARVCHNQALVFTYRIRGDYAENLEKAIALFEKALKIYKAETFPRQWASILGMLAGAYHSRLEGSREENEERAIELYRSALDCAFSGLPPAVRARIKNNMALSYKERIRGSKARNLENAIKLHKEALRTFSREKHPAQWAETCKNLANAYCARKHGTSIENLSFAIPLYEDALTVLTRERSADGWAKTSYALGNVLRRKWEEDGETGALSAAVTSYHDSLSVWQPDTFPGSCLQSAIALAETEAHRRNWNGVQEAALIAREADRTLQISSVTLSGRSENIELSARLYYSASLAKAQQGDYPGAVEWLEQGKTRELEESLARDRAIFEHRLSTEDAAEYRELLSRLRRIETGERLGSLSGSAFTAAVEETRRVRRRFENVIERIRGYEPSFLADLELDDRCFAPLLTEPGKAYVLFNVTSAGTAVILLHGVSGESRFAGFFEEAFKLSDLRRLSKKWMEQVERAEKGENRTRTGRKSWSKRLNDLCRELHDAIFGEVREWLRENGSAINKLVLVPHLDLHSLPLHLMRYDTEEGARFLMDDYEIGFAPSLSLLLMLTRREGETSPHAPSRLRESADIRHFPAEEPLELLAVANPTGDLNWSADEAAEIAGLFGGPCLVLSGAEATRDAFFAAAPRAGVLHLCCHGTYDHENPWKSSLILADARADGSGPTGPSGKKISLDEIFSSISLNRTRLVVLSACETGIIDTGGRSDEFVGLPGGFLRGGAMCVVASLWSVDDRATAALMTRFYQGVAAENRPPSEALKLAQHHLRANRQWRSPYYWGAFRVLGIS